LIISHAEIDSAELTMGWKFVVCFELLGIPLVACSVATCGSSALRSIANDEVRSALDTRPAFHLLHPSVEETKPSPGVRMI
jgi:hypothetical protein